MATLDHTSRRQRPALSDALARNLPQSPPRIVYDGGPARIPGFGLRLSAGRRTWCLNYTTTGGRERRVAIGSFPAWNTAQARKRAAELRRAIDAGADPLGERQAERAAPTIGELIAEYTLLASTKRSWRDDKAMIAAYLAGWSARKVASISAEEVDALHRSITKRAPIRANRVASLISAMFQKVAIRRHWTITNPAAGLARNAETKRTRYLSAPELARLFAILDTWPDQVSAGAVRLLLLTGCRKSELLKATWREFDLDAGQWIKPLAHVKAKRSHSVPLSPQAVAELQRLHPVEAEAEGLVFANSRGKAWTEVAAWPAIRQAAGLADFRLHDLRHSSASIMASGGLSLPTIGAVLGHTQASTTQRYAHLADSTVREAVADLGRAIGGARLRLVS
jgi:integrase